MQPAAHRSPIQIALPLVVICCLLAVAPHDVTDLLAYDREAIQAGQFWRCWTGHLVHFSGTHATLDIAVLFIVSRISERELGTLPIGLAFFLGAPLISLGLLLIAPDLRLYQGASGISTLIGAASGTALWHTAPRLRGILGFLGITILLKTILDANGELPELSSVPVGVRVAWQAHMIGGVLGVLLAACHIPTVLVFKRKCSPACQSVLARNRSRRIDIIARRSL
jgi:rhomboid family GlyGly-CTERM serine protease